jgi:thiol-disulfide isomerase/thioredoxin
MRACLTTVVLVACAAPAPVPTTAPGVLAQIEASRDLDGAVVGPRDGATVVIVMASWCPNCRAELRMFDALRVRHPRVRWLAINYKEHEEYDGRGNAVAMQALAKQLSWLRVVPADEQLYDALGRPALIPTVLVFDGHGALVARFDRRERPPPSAGELEQVLP